MFPNLDIIVKNLTAYIIALIFNITFVCGQNDTAWINNWEKILIVDSHGGWSNFNNEFQILRENLSLTNQNRPDVIIKQINPDLIDSLFLSFKNKRQLKHDPLIMFNLDSTWLINNAENLWVEYLDKRKESSEINSSAINTLKDYPKIKSSIWRLQGSRWTDVYSFISVKIIKGIDTLSISSFGQYPYMLPWDVNGKNIFNAQISKLISQLLPYSAETNKSRLLGKRFNFYLVNVIYENYIYDERKFIKARNKYSRYFNKLEREFEIKHAQMVDMSSIEWGGIFGKPCLEFLLVDSCISNQIQFSAIYGRPIVLYTPNSILKGKVKLIKLLNDNPVYNYAINNEGCLGKIHWVQSKSLSKKAKNNFLRDVEDQDKSINQYKGKFKNAIFFEFTEDRDSKKSFSRWIFLQDGTLILWQLEGDYLMGLSKDMIEKQGYICRNIKLEELVTKPNRIDE